MLRMTNWLARSSSINFNLEYYLISIARFEHTSENNPSNCYEMNCDARNITTAIHIMMPPFIFDVSNLYRCDKCLPLFRERWQYIRDSLYLAYKVIAAASLPEIACLVFELYFDAQQSICYTYHL